MIPSTKVYLGIYTKVEAVVVTTVVKLKEQLKLWQLTNCLRARDEHETAR